MTDGGENCQVKVPAVLLLEMTSAYIQVLLRVKGKSNSIVVWYMNHPNKIWTFMLEFHVPPYLLYIRRISITVVQL